MTGPNYQPYSVHIVDSIGVHSSMETNNQAMARALVFGGWKPHVVSNYLDNEFPNPLFLVLPNIYKGRNWRSVILLLKATFAFARYVRTIDEPRALWLLHNYGLRLTDLIFLAFLWRCRFRTVLVIHDVLSVRSRENAFLVALKSWIYRSLPKGLIVHSSNATEKLRSLGYSGPITEINLFRTPIAKVACESAVHIPELRNAFLKEKNRIKILLFGSIRRSKGIDIALAALREMTPRQRSNCMLIIAGRDSEGLLGTIGHEIPTDGSVLVVDRFISNQERETLYSNVDFLLLPYREVYQSGILEQAVAYRVRVLASSIPPFQKFFEDYPSFGAVYGSDEIDLRDAIINTQQGELPGGKNSYCINEIASYESHDPLYSFASKLQEMLEIN